MNQTEAIELIKQRFGKKQKVKKKSLVFPIIGGSMLLLFFICLFLLATMAPQVFEGAPIGVFHRGGLISLFLSLGLTGYIVTGCYFLVRDL